MLGIPWGKCPSVNWPKIELLRRLTVFAGELDFHPGVAGGGFFGHGEHVSGHLAPEGVPFEATFPVRTQSGDQRTVGMFVCDAVIRAASGAGGVADEDVRRQIDEHGTLGAVEAAGLVFRDQPCLVRLLATAIEEEHSHARLPGGERQSDGFLTEASSANLPFSFISALQPMR